MKVLVIGGTLFIGRALVTELVKAGHEVTVLHRRAQHDLGAVGRKQIGNLMADRNDPAQIREALAGQRFEVVFDNVYDWERGTTAAQVEATAMAAGDSLRRYVFVSSVAAYGAGLNHHEGDGLAGEDHPDSYVRNKANSERALFRLHQRYGLPAVTLRPPYIYGPGNPFHRESFFWERFRDNRKVIVPGDGRRLMQFVYVRDLVAAAMAAMTAPGAVGHAFNVANAKAITQMETVLALAEAAGKKGVEMAKVPREKLLQAGGHPMGPKLYFGFYFDLPPITMLVTKAQRMLLFRPTEFAAGLKETFKAWKAVEGTLPVPDYAYEDSVL
ncbi:MAG: NAD-dependent epimerase/dehydratase family protein [Acidobacteria bacterium]|nr:NAD-dependent epimerase/dehydratase family protein [Acidobacteriota bacterium]